jgi:hypothetical protein
MSGVPLRVTAGVLLATSLLGIRSAFAEPGDLDPAFGEGGLAPPTGIQIDATAVAHQADGKLVVVGAYDSIPGNYPDFLLDDHDFIVARLNTDGTVDTDFGIGGAAIADYAGYMDVPYAVVLQPPDGKVVMAATSEWPASTPTARSMPRSAMAAGRSSTSAVLTMRLTA